MEGEIAEVLPQCSHAEGISERGSPRVAVAWLPRSHCIARAAPWAALPHPEETCAVQEPLARACGVNRTSNSKMHIWPKPKCPCRGIHHDWTAEGTCRTGHVRGPALYSPELFWELPHLQVSPLYQRLCYLQHFPSQSFPGKTSL